MCSEFKTYHCKIVDSLESDEDATHEQEVLDEHQKKTMEFIDRLGEILARPQIGATTLVSTNIRLIDKQLDVIADSTISIQRDLEKAESVDIPILTNHVDKIKSLEGELQALKKEILSLDDNSGHLERASHIENTLSELWVHVTIYCLMKKARKEPYPKVVKMPMIDKVNLP